jgi:glucose uptake protein GlcU
LQLTTIGFIGGLTAGLFFGLYPIPRRYVKFGINDYMISMSLGVLFFSIMAAIIGKIPVFALSLNQWLIGILAGICWCLGTILYVYSVDCIGIGRSTPIKNLTAILGIIFGLIIFKEYQTLNLTKTISLVIGTGLLIYSGKILGVIQGQENIARASCPVNIIVPDFFHKNRKNALTAGWILALGAALMYAIFSVPVRILSDSTNTVYQFLPAVAIGALTISLILDKLFTSRHTWRKISFKGHLLALSSGGLWSIAFIGLATGLKYLGVSIGWPLANSSTVFSVIYAVFIAQEINYKINKKTIISGLCLGILGIIFLGLSM